MSTEPDAALPGRSVDVRGWIRRLLSLAIWSLSPLLVCLGQSEVDSAKKVRPNLVQIEELTPAQLLSLQEIENAIAEQRLATAIDQILEIVVSRPSQLIRVPAGDEAFATYVPLAQYLHDQLMRWSVTQPALVSAYRDRVDSLARKRLELAQSNRDLQQADQVATDFFASRWGDDALFLASELAASQGWFDRSRLYLQRIDRRFQATRSAPVAIPVIPVPWSLALNDQTPITAAVQQSMESLAESGLPFLTYAQTDLSVETLWQRLRVCESARHGSSTGVKVVPVPRWHVALPSPSHQIRDYRTQLRFWGDRLLCKRPSHLLAFDRASGNPWPIATRSVPLWEASVSARDLSVVSQQTYPTLWESLSVTGDLAAFRDGPPAGQIPGTLVIAEDMQSRITVVDLQREGRLLEGFPWRLTGDTWRGFEIEGSPTLTTDRLFFGITRRTPAGTESRVVCLDLYGRTQWITAPLSIARRVAGADGLPGSHAQVIYDQGELFYQCGAGAITSLNPLDGSVRWLTTYPRSELAQSAYPHASRTTRRLRSPILVDAELVFALPDDSDRLLALHRGTGQVIWTTAPGEVEDATTPLEVTDDHVLLDGARLFWIDKRRGRVSATFPPAASSPLPGASAAPRGVSGATVWNQQIFWPTEHSIYVFDAPLYDRSFPRMQQQIDLKALGLTGGILIANATELMLAQFESIAAFDLVPRSFQSPSSPSSSR